MFEFKKSSEKLNIMEVEYLKRIFDNSLKIGTEIEVQFKQHIDFDEVREDFEVPNSNFMLNKHGVAQVKTDGSLQNGLEIITAGRTNVGFLPTFFQYKSIITKIDDYEPYIHQRMGWHNHMLISHYENKLNELEYPLKSIVLDNYINIVKKFLPCLFFISSSIYENESLTRRSFFSNHLFMYNSLTDDSNIKRAISASCDDRYRAINFDKMKLDERNDITKLHFEIRFPDGNIIPSAMTALNYLYRAILYYALDSSYLGLVKTCKNEEEAVELNKLMMFKNSRLNGDLNEFTSLQRKLFKDVFESKHLDKAYEYDSDRLSVPVKEDIVELLKTRSLEMVEELKNYLYYLDKTGFSYEILKHLAVEPISIMKKNGLSVDSINEKLEDKIVVEKPCIEDEIYKLVFSKEIKNTLSPADWISKASAVACFKEGEEGIKNILNNISKYKNISYSNELGFYFK